MMIRSSRMRAAVRAGVFAAGLHLALVVPLVVAKNASTNASDSWLFSLRALSMLEAPIEAAANVIGPRVPLLPPALAVDRLWVAISVNEIAVYGVLGGLFYGGVAAVVALWLRRRSSSERAFGAETSG